MAAYTQGERLADLRVDAAMAKEAIVCSADDPLVAAEDLMRTHRVRRLPVVDRDQRLVGIVSLSDIARSALAAEEVAVTLAAVCQPHASPKTMPRPRRGRVEKEIVVQAS